MVVVLGSECFRASGGSDFGWGFQGIGSDTWEAPEILSPASFRIQGLGLRVRPTPQSKKA